MDKIYHLVSTDQLTRPIVEKILIKAEMFEKLREEDARNLDDLRGVTVGSYFFEESTRTRFSIERAAHLLGADVITTENAAKFSSAAKGEDLVDSIRVIGGGAGNVHLSLVDIIVLRHPEGGAAEIAAKASGVPVINAGDGERHHPLQALTDLYAFKKTLGRLDNFTIAFVGDLRNSRIIFDLAVLLSRYSGINMVFIAPRGFRVREELKLYLRKKNIEFSERDSLKTTVNLCDLVYIVRVQKNRMKGIKGNLLIMNYQRKKDNYALTPEIYRMSEKRGTLFFHPMPVDKKEKEIRPEVKLLPRVKMYEQANYKLVIAMAVFTEVWQNHKYRARTT